MRGVQQSSGKIIGDYPIFSTEKLGIHETVLTSISEEYI